MVYLLQKHRRKLGREVEDLKTLAQRAILAQHAVLAQCIEVTCRSQIPHEGVLSMSRALSANSLAKRSGLT
ncbi:hypothetical protein HKD37_04G011731 [Glycine soja]